MKSLLTLGLLVTLGACTTGSSGEGGGTGGGSGGGAGGAGAGGGGGAISTSDGGLNVKVACTVLNARKCEYLQRCGLISEPAVRDCLAWLQATSCGQTKWSARVDPMVATLRYDPAVGQACAEAWQARACQDYGGEPAACGSNGLKFVLPNALAGQSCYDGYSECVDPMMYVCRGATCPRKCSPRGATGQDCRETSDCSSALYCRITNLATGAGKCTAYGLADAGCDVDQPCSSGPPSLVCYAGRCTQPPPANSACLGSICDENAWCLSAPDGGTCKPRGGPGGSCTDDVQCLPNLLCEVLTGQCVARTLPTVGATCGQRQTCPAGTVCLRATPTALGECQPPLDAGLSCNSSNDCQAHLACIGLDGGLALGCGPRQSDGMRCTENRDCQVLSVCKGQTCTRRPTTGDSCTATQSCLFGPCVAADAGSICTEPFGPGVVCAVDADCGSGRCVIGKCLPACTP